MCGIAGLLYSDPRRPVHADVLWSMGHALAHRGPDAEGIWRRDGIGLAHRRLSIIDLDGGDQPLGNEDGSLQVVFNGEIYNYRELRRALASKGHQFRTESDTEVLVHLYEEAGVGLVDRLRGMFAFALWDARRRRLLLARDRVGLKPLYYYRDEEKLLFASEIKGILAHPEVKVDIDIEALEDYLAFGVIPGEKSIFRQIRKLPPGHVLCTGAEALESRPQRYWRLNLDADESRTASEWLEAIEEKFRETVQAHRIADVPVGAFLSGGLDSSAVVAALADSDGASIRTFSVGFEEEAFSELPYARRLAHQYGTNHVEHVVTADAVAGLEDLVHFYDEPFADSSAVPTMAICRSARESVKVVLSGDGGDEAFGGYSRYLHDLREARLRARLPKWLRRILIRRLARVWPKADWLPRPLRAKTVLTNLALDDPEAYANTISVCRAPLRRQLFNADVCRQLNGYRPEAFVNRSWKADDHDTLRGMLATDIEMLLPDDFLTKVDRASMAVGLEVRPPMVDHEFLELAARVPSRFKVQGRETKWLFKQLCRRRLPSEVIERPKRGFEIPVDAWLRGPLRDTFEASVLSPSSPLAEYVNQQTIRRLYRSHLRRTGRHGPLLWSLLVLGRWMEKFGTHQASGRGSMPATV